MPHWLKGSQPHMQCDFCRFNSARANLRKYLRSEVQARGWRGGRSFVLREDGLVALTVGGGIFAIYIRWQRDVPEPLDDREKILFRAFRQFETQSTFAEFAARHHFGCQLSASSGS